MTTTPTPTPPTLAHRTPALLGLDLGSSSLKALLLDLAGRVLAVRSAAYPTRSPAPGWAEQELDDWWSACGVATRAALADAPTAEVVGIGLSGQMHTFVLLDAAGAPVRPAVTWMDTRAAGSLPEVAARIRAAGVADELANPVALGLSLPPLGEPAARAGGLTREAARHLGLPAGIPVAFGAGDQQAAAVGTGTVTPGQAQLMVGTGAQALVVEDAPPAGVDPRLHAFCHVRGWLRQASVNNAGVALGWARAILGLDWAELYGALGDEPPGAAPLFLPYLTGERAPLMKGHARGGWLALEPGHDRAALARAAVAGVVTAIADGLRALPGDPDRRVRAGGGGLRDAGFAQAVADASGATLDVLDASDASAVGAAMLGGIAAGAYPDLDAAVGAVRPAVARTLRPRPDREGAWASLRERFGALDALGLHEALAAG